MTEEELREYTAEREAAVVAQRQLVARLQRLADDERRELADMERSLTDFRTLLRQRGLDAGERGRR